MSDDSFPPLCTRLAPSHLKASVEPMSLPLPRFATQVMSTSPKGAPSTNPLTSQMFGGSNTSSTLSSTTPLSIHPSTGGSVTAGNGLLPSGSTTSPTTPKTTRHKSPITELKSPPITNSKNMLSMGLLGTSKIATIGTDISNWDTSTSTGRPHDPRLLLQVASTPIEKSIPKERDTDISYSPTYVPKSPRGSNKNRIGGGLASDIEDISDAEKDETEISKEVDEVDDDADALNSSVLEARLKAFSKNYEKWSGSSKMPAGMLAPQVASGAASVTSGPSGISTPTGSATPSASATPALLPTSNAVTSITPLQGVTSSSVTATSQGVVGGSPITNCNLAGHQTTVTGGANTPLLSLSGTPSTPLTGNSSSLVNKFALDLKPTQPSPIVQRLLSRKSVFDEDSKRLESSSSSLDVVPPLHEELEQHNSKNMSVGSVNFSAGYNTISTLSDKASHLSSSSLLASSVPQHSTSSLLSISSTAASTSRTVTTLSSTTVSNTKTVLQIQSEYFCREAVSSINSSSKDNKVSSLSSSIISRNTPTSQPDGDHASTPCNIVSKENKKTISASPTLSSKCLSPLTPATYTSTDNIFDKAKVTDIEQSSNSDVNKQPLSTSTSDIYTETIKSSSEVLNSNNKASSGSLENKQSNP